MTDTHVQLSQDELEEQQYIALRTKVKEGFENLVDTHFIGVDFEQLQKLDALLNELGAYDEISF